MGNFFSSEIKNNDLISIIEKCDKNDWKCIKKKINDEDKKLGIQVIDLTTKNTKDKVVLSLNEIRQMEDIKYYILKTNIDNDTCSKTLNIEHICSNRFTEGFTNQKTNIIMNIIIIIIFYFYIIKNKK